MVGENSIFVLIKDEHKNRLEMLHISQFLCSSKMSTKIGWKCYTFPSISQVSGQEK